MADTDRHFENLRFSQSRTSSDDLAETEKDHHKQVCDDPRRFQPVADLIVIAKIKLQRAQGGCLGTKSR